ncbi:hypothetical protein A2U01_0010862, partial [Trifolium medium]|nr:hypothetical protein [Trifolium medium]
DSSSSRVFIFLQQHRFTAKPKLSGRVSTTATQRRSATSNSACSIQRNGKDVHKSYFSIFNFNFTSFIRFDLIRFVGVAASSSPAASIEVVANVALLPHEGVKTMVVVSAVPLGVVQLGSLTKTLYVL